MSILPKGCLVFDIGAHHGETAQRLLSDHGAGSVVCIEPSMANYAVLQERCASEPRVHMVHAAVLREAGIARISHAAAQDGLSTIAPERWGELYPDADYQEPEWVAALDYRAIFRRFGTPHYMKVDVEGLEYDVLLGLVSMHTMNRPRLITFEFHGARADDAENCLYLLRDMRYEKAVWETEEPSLLHLPATSIGDALDAFRKARPEWGNFTVA